MHPGIRSAHFPLGNYSRTMGDVRRSGDLLRVEFLCAQGAVLLATYYALRIPGYFITASDILFGLAFFVRLCTGRLTRPFGEMTWLWVAGVAMLIGGLFVGSLVHGEMLRGTILIGQYCFAFILVPLALLGRPIDQVIRLIECAVWGMTLMCVIGIAVYLTGFSSTGGEQWEFVSGNRRLSGFVDNPNGMAILIVLTIPLTWFLLLSRRMHKALAFFCLAVLLTGLILTSSNTGLLGFAVATLIFFAGRRSFKTLLVVALAGTALFLSGQNYLPETFNNRVLNAASTGDIQQAGTYAHRHELITEAVAMSDDHIVVGLGADRYRMVSEWGQPVHNTYLLLLVEGGALSLFGLLAIIGAAIVTVLISPTRLFGGLVALTTITIAIVFALLLNGMPHIYARGWILPLLLALSPAITCEVAWGRHFRPERLSRRRAGRAASTTS